MSRDNFECNLLITFSMVFSISFRCCSDLRWDEVRFKNLRDKISSFIHLKPRHECLKLKVLSHKWRMRISSAQQSLLHSWHAIFRWNSTVRDLHHRIWELLQCCWLRKNLNMQPDSDRFWHRVRARVKQDLDWQPDSFVAVCIPECHESRLIAFQASVSSSRERWNE